MSPDMRMTRRAAAQGGAALLAVLAAPARAQGRMDAVEAHRLLARLMLELVRHTPTYSPPVASRAFAYVGVAGFEALAQGDPRLRSLAGQIRHLAPPPPRAPGPHDEAAVLEATLSRMLRHHFANTGPAGQRALAAMAGRLSAAAAAGLAPDVAERSRAQGLAVAEHVIAWGRDDGGERVENMGFPLDWTPGDRPGSWRPTRAIVQQQAPLLPRWGENRAFALPDGGACPLPPPLAYDPDAASAFMTAAREVQAAVRDLTPDQRALARFWSDDPMLSPTPPGHWISIAAQLLDEEGADLARRVEVMALLGVTLADAFIACWKEKFRWDYVRPVTVIRELLDPAWEPILATPPFPEYPSGHSTQSGAAAEVLTALFGGARAFADRTHEADGLGVRRFDSLWHAADEAGLSRLYGGIHFRAAIVQGLDQGRCVGGHALRLETRA